MSIRNLFLLLRHPLFPQMSTWRGVAGMPSAFVPCGTHGRKRVLWQNAENGLRSEEWSESSGPSGGCNVGASFCVGWQNERLSGCSVERSFSIIPKAELSTTRRGTRSFFRPSSQPPAKARSVIGAVCANRGTRANGGRGANGSRFSATRPGPAGPTG